MYSLLPALKNEKNEKKKKKKKIKKEKKWIIINISSHLISDDIASLTSKKVIFSLPIIFLSGLYLSILQ